MYQRALTYYSTARNFHGGAAATGRHFLSHLDTALHRNLRWLLDQPGPRDGEPDAVAMPGRG